jgi:hypothetical protein
MCTSPEPHTNAPRPCGGGGEDPEYDPLHRGRRPEELTLSELLERIAVMMELRPILLLLTGHDHCPVCLGCCLPEDTPEGDEARA